MNRINELVEWLESPNDNTDEVIRLNSVRFYKFLHGLEEVDKLLGLLPYIKLEEE